MSLLRYEEPYIRKVYPKTAPHPFLIVPTITREYINITEWLCRRPSPRSLAQQDSHLVAGQMYIKTSPKYSVYSDEWRRRLGIRNQRSGHATKLITKDQSLYTVYPESSKSLHDRSDQLYYIKFSGHTAVYQSVLQYSSTRCYRNSIVYWDVGY